MQVIQVKPHFQPIVGCALLALSLLGDCALGLLVLAGASIQVLWLHIPAALLYVVSINLVGKRESQQEPKQYSSKLRLNRTSLTALFLCLLAFPGFSLFANAIAFIIVRYLPQGATAEPLDDTMPARQIARPLAMQVQPLTDILHNSDLETRRAAVTALGHLPTSGATQLLRQLLSDPYAEIRSDASIILTRLEDELTRTLNVALERWKSDPQDVAYTLGLADEYYRYASSNVLDATSQRAYLVKALKLALEVVARDETHVEGRLKLARIRQHLGETAAALEDVLLAIKLKPGADAYLLAMELAFRLHSWNALASLAAEGVSALSNAAESPALLTCMQWWMVPLSTQGSSS